MSQKMTSSVNGSTGKSRQTVQSYQPVWMAHWMRASSNALDERRNDSVSMDSKNGSESSRPVKEPMVETKPFAVVNDSLRMSSRGLENEGLFNSVTNNGQDIDGTKEFRSVLGKSIERGKDIDYKSGVQAANEPSLRKFHSLGEGTSNKPLEWMRTHSSTHIEPYNDLEKHESDKGKSVIRPLVNRPSVVPNNLLPYANLRMLDHENCRKQSQSHAPINACFKEFNTPLFFGRDWLQKMRKCSGIGFLPPHIEETELKKSEYDLYSLKKLPNCVHDMETMRICTTVDSVQATPGGCPRFSQTTHSLLITKKTDVNILQENDVFKTSRLFTKMDENTSKDLTLTPFFGHGNRGVKLQPLSSFSNSEGKRNFENVTINNESSETDTMDIDFFNEKKLNSGANSTPSTKGFNIDSNLSPLIEIGHQQTNTALPDINLKHPALPAIETSPGNLCPSSSRTQSLEMNILLAHAEQNKEPKSNDLFNDLDPSNRWVKRLKVSSSNSSSQGTKTLSLGENLSHDKMKYFKSVLDNSIATSSEPKPRKDHGKQIILSEKNKELSKEDEELTIDTLKKDRESLLSNVWIKRWLKNGSRNTEEKPDRAVEKVGKPQNSIVSLRDVNDDVQKKQFPSIAAMALMGKAMNGLQSCELQKRGPFTVWYTKAL